MLINKGRIEEQHAGTFPEVKVSWQKETKMYDISMYGFFELNKKYEIHLEKKFMIAKKVKYCNRTTPPVETPVAACEVTMPDPLPKKRKDGKPNDEKDCIAKVMAKVRGDLLV